MAFKIAGVRNTLKSISVFAACLTLALPALGSPIDISTGVASWQVFVSGSGFVPVTSVTPNVAWAEDPTGASWVSYAANEGTSCVVGQTPGNGCANTLIDPIGDTWSYTLGISAAELGATSGSLSFVFGGDNLVNLFIGVGGKSESWSGGGSSLGCSAPSAATSAGNANPYTCTTSVSFDASDLNVDGSLTLDAFANNSLIAGCLGCGDPTGFVLAGSISTSGTVTGVPEPASVVVLLSGMLGLRLFRRRATPTPD